MSGYNSNSLVVVRPLRFDSAKHARWYMGYRDGEKIPMELSAEVMYKLAGLELSFPKEVVWLQYDFKKREVFLFFAKDFIRKYLLTRKVENLPGNRIAYEFYEEGTEVIIQVIFINE